MYHFFILTSICLSWSFEIKWPSDALTIWNVCSQYLRSLASAWDVPELLLTPSLLSCEDSAAEDMIFFEL